MIEIKKLQNADRIAYETWKSISTFAATVSLRWAAYLICSLYNIERADTSPFLVHFSLLSQCPGMRAVWPKSHHNHLNAEGKTNLVWGLFYPTVWRHMLPRSLLIVFRDLCSSIVQFLKDFVLDLPSSGLNLSPYLKVTTKRSTWCRGKERRRSCNLNKPDNIFLEIFSRILFEWRDQNQTRDTLTVSLSCLINLSKISQKPDQLFHVRDAWVEARAVHQGHSWAGGQNQWMGKRNNKDKYLFKSNWRPI